jgi:C4-dicarboxylate transporter DctM subunit
LIIQACLLFGVFFALLIFEVPVAISLGLSASVILLVFQIQNPIIIAQQIFSGLDSYNLLAIPLFLVAGHLLGESAIAKRLLDFILILLGRIRGGIAIVTVIVSLLFAGISGSGPADVAALGALLFPILTKSGFPAARSAALLAAGGGIGIIVPPSIALILYGVVSETSISRLFLAGVVPGILVSLGLIIACLFLSRKDQISHEIPKLQFSIIGGALLAAIAPIIILGGIYCSIFNPTESAGAAVLYIVIVDSIFYRSLWKKSVFHTVFARAGRNTAQIFFIIAGGSLFSYVLQVTYLTDYLSESILSLTNNPILILLLINTFLLIVGCFIDAVSIIFIFVPIFLPVIHQIQIDPVHFGIILTVNLAIGQITPPIGVNLFVASTFSQIDIAKLSWAIIPFVIAEIIVLIFIIIFPTASLWLPNLLN